MCGKSSQKQCCRCEIAGRRLPGECAWNCRTHGLLGRHLRQENGRGVPRGANSWGKSHVHSFREGVVIACTRLAVLHTARGHQSTNRTTRPMDVHIIMHSRLLGHTRRQENTGCRTFPCKQPMTACSFEWLCWPVSGQRAQRPDLPLCEALRCMSRRNHQRCESKKSPKSLFLVRNRPLSTDGAGNTGKCGACCPRKHSGYLDAFTRRLRGSVKALPVLERVALRPPRNHDFERCNKGVASLKRAITDVFSNDVIGACYG